MIFGYINTINADKNAQLESLKPFACDDILFDDNAENLKSRKHFNILIQRIQSNDTLVVYSLEVLGLSLKSIVEFIVNSVDSQIRIISIIDNFDSHKKDELKFIQLLNSLLIYDSNLKLERTALGVEIAQKNGKQLGRPKGLSDELISKLQSVKQMLNSNLSNEQIYTALNIPRSSYYNYLKIIDQIPDISPEHEIP